MSKTKAYARSTEGLRDALFDEMADLRAGIATPQEASAFANLAGRIIESVQADIAVQQLAIRKRQLELDSAELTMLPGQEMVTHGSA